MYDFICKWRREAQIRPSRKKGYQKQDYLIESDRSADQLAVIHQYGN